MPSRYERVRRERTLREAAEASTARIVDGIDPDAPTGSTPGLEADEEPENPLEQDELGTNIVLADHDARTELARSRLAGVQRDQYGLPETALSLSDQQYRWLSYRLDAESDAEADFSAGVAEAVRQSWQMNPDFRAVCETAQENKREAFRMLSAQLLPRTLRTLYDMLSSNDRQAQKAAATLILRSQALLIDRPPQTDQNALADLLTVLRERRDITPMEVDPR